MERTVLGLGEILWDLFPSGPQFGGAPANFACSAAGLSDADLRVALVSGVGQDELGEQALSILRRKGVDTSWVARHQESTGRVHIELDSRGIASYRFEEDTAWDHLAWNAKLRQLALRADAVCFGTLGQRSTPSRDAIQRFVATTATDCLRLFDINLRPPYFDYETIDNSLRLANVLKLNEEELDVLAKHEKLSGEPSVMLRALADRFDLHCIALTCGADGSTLIRGAEMSQTDPVSTQVMDTVGAGDSFSAALTLGLLADAPLNQIHQYANQVSAYVCSQAGATPRFPAELKCAW
jgi:fructokinase